MKTATQLERYFKGAANHRRLEILLLIDSKPNLSLESITDLLDANTKTISEHTRKLVQAGLLNKRYEGRSVSHNLSPYGELFVKFIKDFK
jgi:predicted transcriptional regulator